MKEHPILFSAPMVNAILDGRKTMTRRIIKARRGESIGVYSSATECEVIRCDLDGEPIDADPLVCPCGAPGDRLWVRETFAITHRVDSTPGGQPYDPHVRYFATDNGEPPLGPQFEKFRWRPSIHMPRKLSRIALEVTSVRAERLQDITQESALSEGVESACIEDLKQCHVTPVMAFRKLWDSINESKAPWSSNPWVWVVGFKRIGGPQ